MRRIWILRNLCSIVAEFLLYSVPKFKFSHNFFCPFFWAWVGIGKEGMYIYDSSCWWRWDVVIFSGSLMEEIEALVHRHQDKLSVGFMSLSAIFVFIFIYVVIWLLVVLIRLRQFRPRIRATKQSWLWWHIVGRGKIVRANQSLESFL